MHLPYPRHLVRPARKIKTPSSAQYTKYHAGCRGCGQRKPRAHRAQMFLLSDPPTTENQVTRPRREGEGKRAGRHRYHHAVRQKRPLPRACQRGEQKRTTTADRFARRPPTIHFSTSFRLRYRPRGRKGLDHATSSSSSPTRPLRGEPRTT